MSSQVQIFSVIEAFYDAALDESLWSTALQGLVGLTKSQAATFWVLDGSENPRHSSFACINFDMSGIQEYLDHMTPLDPWPRYVAAHPQQPIIHDALVISERDKDRHPYYDWHRRGSDTRFRMVGQTHSSRGVQAGVAMHRTRSAGCFEASDVEQFALLHRHLERALAIAIKIGSLGTIQRAMTDWWDQSPSAVFFLDERRRILFCNQRARALQCEKDGIRFDDGKIALSRSQDNGQLQSLLSQTCSPQSPDASPVRAMSAVRPSGKRPYGIFISPISGKYPVLSTTRPVVCVVITDPANETPIPMQHLRAAFGLTAAESKLAAILASGDAIQTAADKLGITYGTARTRLAQIFQKTQTRRQSELIRVLRASLGTA